MNEGLIPSRYAKALYKFALDKGESARVYELMKTLSASFAGNDELQSVMANPFVADADKVALLNTASGATAKDSCFHDFIKLLISNKRIEFVRSIALAYGDLYRHENNIYRVNTVMASKMPQAEEARLKAMIEKHLGGAAMEYTSTIDPTLIGGFVVNIDSERLDASIKNELKQLRLKLLSK